ncbi:hypothetical protein GGC65_003678 [Sphingopyxis sp. OAS728]|uniref:hypothetical protein n=1 Tax=Sphingopyxis sp. OAS728 TaxID=2663823 RepID=UPI001789F207|nr:hypothetical protein [Sphingopyxis sp. OAS728]MBE1529222.1 hypothetical protein [Sphingopyxis sp. OAS728]
MTEEEELTRIDRYELRNGWTMRRAGLKGLRIQAEIVDGAAPALILTGSRRGRLEIPLADIDYIRASVDQGKFRWADSYRCLIWRAGEPKLVLAPTSFGKIIYGELILELARAMKRVGRFDRVERGLQRWETIFYSIFMVLAAAFIAYAAWDTLQMTRGPMEGMDFIFLGVTGGFSLFLVVASVRIWGDIGPPRPVRSLKDLREVLP